MNFKIQDAFRVPFNDNSCSDIFNFASGINGKSFKQ